MPIKDIQIPCAYSTERQIKYIRRSFEFDEAHHLSMLLASVLASYDKDPPHREKMADIVLSYEKVLGRLLLSFPEEHRKNSLDWFQEHLGLKITLDILEKDPST